MSQTAVVEPLVANVVEVFSGIQGEGLYVGCRQLFVRFAGCHLQCRYCDSRESWRVPATCQVERRAGAREFMALANPLALRTLHDVIVAVDAPRGLHHSVALTGGEPLLHAPFLAALLPGVRAMGLCVFLETNGALPDALARLIDQVDIISMDIKIASATGQPANYADNRRFLRLARRAALYVKVVVTRETTDAELAEVARLVAEEDAAIPLVVQPVTPVTGIEAPTPDQVLRFQEAAAMVLRDVRVIPQTHKAIGQK